jgi:hypothetical protein
MIEHIFKAVRMGLGSSRIEALCNVALTGSKV